MDATKVIKVDNEELSTLLDILEKNTSTTANQPPEFLKEPEKIVEPKNTKKDIYDALYQPIFISLLYFIFQMPFFKKFLYKNMPFIFSTTEKLYNIYGLIFTSVLFSLCFYSFTLYFKKE